MSVTKEQAMAYTEVIEILKYMSNEDVNKIPKDVLNYYKTNMDKTHNFRVDVLKSFEEQNLSEKAKIVLAILFRDYWATEQQREKIIQKEKYDEYISELEKKKQYEVDNIFKKKNINKEENNTALVVYEKEKWYINFINFMKRIFKIK